MLLAYFVSLAIYLAARSFMTPIIYVSLAFDCIPLPYSFLSHGDFDGSQQLIEQSGFAENYDPITGTPCGGGNFSWTAAMVIEFLTGEPQIA